MASVRADIRSKLREITRRGHALPVERDGKIVWLTSVDSDESSVKPNDVFEEGFAEKGTKWVGPPQE